MRLRPIGLLLCGVVVASSACSMDATTPSSLAAPRRSAMSEGVSGGSFSRGDWASRLPDAARLSDATTATYTVTIDPQRTSLLRFGAYTVAIPGNAICDLKSGYGLQEFDLECKSEKDPVTITAVVRATASGIPRIDLMPEMRFNPKRTVTLTLSVPALTPASSAWTILYCATSASDQCVDESLADPTLATHVDFQASTLFRRIKHFSGYFVET